MGGLFYYGLRRDHCENALAAALASSGIEAQAPGGTRQKLYKNISAKVEWLIQSYCRDSRASKRKVHIRNSCDTPVMARNSADIQGLHAVVCPRGSQSFFSVKDLSVRATLKCPASQRVFCWKMRFFAESTPCCGVLHSRSAETCNRSQRRHAPKAACVQSDGCIACLCAAILTEPLPILSVKSKLQAKIAAGQRKKVTFL